MKDYELLESERANFTEEQLKTYDQAIRYTKNEWAGSYDGWSVGHDLLKGLGWREEKVIEGHRAFVKLVKPC